MTNCFSNINPFAIEQDGLDYTDWAKLVNRVVNYMQVQVHAMS